MLPQIMAPHLTSMFERPGALHDGEGLLLDVDVSGSHLQDVKQLVVLWRAKVDKKLIRHHS